MKEALEKSSFPALFYAADAAAISEQKIYVHLFRWVLVLTVSGSFVFALASFWTFHLVLLRTIGGACLCGTLFITLVIRNSQREKNWFGARAVAESVKTRTWRYLMCAEPYHAGLSAQEADRRFAEDLTAILKETNNLSFAWGGDSNKGPQISIDMADFRVMNWKNRLDAYLQQRVSDQRDWYTKKAKASKALETRYFFTVLVLQLVSIVVAFLLVAYPSLKFNPIGFLTSLTSSLLAWLQLKRYQETSQSYSVASQELGLIQAQSRHVTGDENLSQFVQDSENAFSREHTLWIARKG
jgi:hypothetical protein